MPPLLPALLFGLRAAASGMLALYLAFVFQLDQPGWAATSAVIVAQPVLGASLRKGSFRLIGTLVGAVFPVLLIALFPQDRVGFLVGLAVWGAACSFASSFLRETVAYAPMLAGYTAAIVATAGIGQPGSMFLLAVDRGSGIALGVLCTTVVFSATDLGHQRWVLADRLEALGRAVLAGLRGVLGDDPAPLDAQRDARRALVRQAAELDTLVEQATGENLDLRRRADFLRRGVAGLFAALAGWRAIEQHLRRLATDIGATRAALRRRLDDPPVGGGLPVGLHARAASLLGEPARTPGERLLLDSLGDALDGLAATADAILLLREGREPAAEERNSWAGSGDWLTALVNAARALLVTGAAMLIWVLTGWTSGPIFVTFAMVVVLLYALREEAAFAGASIMAAGCVLALLAACIAKFAVLPLLQGPGLESFAGLALVAGGFVAITGAASVALRQGTTAAGLAFATMANFMPLFSPTNEIAYDYAGFLNTAIAIIAGASLGAAGYRLVPPLAAGLRARRLIAGARRDLVRLIRGRAAETRLAWTRRFYTRLVRLPPQASLAEHGQVLAALSVGQEFLRAHAIAATPPEARTAQDELRLAASRQEIAEAVASHPAYLGGLGL